MKEIIENVKLVENAPLEEPARQYYFMEKETIILTNEEDRYYSVYTFNQGLQKRLKNFAERYPECCYLSNSTKEGSETYIIQKGRLSLNLRPPYAKERIQKALETIQIAREEKLDDS